MPALLQESPRRSPRWVSDSPLEPRRCSPRHHHDIDAAQARVDRLSEQADARRSAATTSAAAEAREARSQPSHDDCRAMRRNQRLIDTLRAQVRRHRRRQVQRHRRYRRTAPPRARRSTRRSRRTPTTLLTNVVLVSEDTGARRRCPGTSERAARAAEPAQGRAADQARPARPCASRPRAAWSGPCPTRQAKAAATLEALRPSGSPRSAARPSPTRSRRSATPTSTAPRDRRRSTAPGLTMAAWCQAGVSLPHSSSAQYSSGRHISESELQPGDLVFYYSPISHVGMYIGDGQIVNALNPGAGVVRSPDCTTCRTSVRCALADRIAREPLAHSGAGGFVLFVVLALPGRRLLRCDVDVEIAPTATADGQPPSTAEAAQQALDELVAARCERSADAAEALGRTGVRRRCSAGSHDNARALRRAATSRCATSTRAHRSTEAQRRSSRVRDAWRGTVAAAYRYGGFDSRRPRVETERGLRARRRRGARSPSFGGADARTPLWLADRLQRRTHGARRCWRWPADAAGRYPRLVGERRAPGARGRCPDWNGPPAGRGARTTRRSWTRRCRPSPGSTTTSPRSPPPRTARSPPVRRCGCS